MSQPVTCDACGAEGRRKLGRVSPDGWHFLALKNQDDPEDTLVVYACSDACKRLEWQEGPGDLSRCSRA